MQEKETKLKLLQNECESLLKMSKEDTERLEEKAQEIQRLKRTNAKLQKENVNLKRDKRNAGKPDTDFTPRPATGRSRASRGTLYVPSTQKLGLGKKKKSSKEVEDLFNSFDYDEKIDQIGNNIFNKITETVDKICNVPKFERRATFTGYSMEPPDLSYNPDTYRMQTIVDKTPKDKDKFEENFKEITEAPEDEERDTRKGFSRVHGDRSTTFFFNEDSSNSDSEAEGDSSKPSKVKSEVSKDSDAKEKVSEDTKEENQEEVKKKFEEYKQKEDQLIQEINTLTKAVEEEEGEGQDTHKEGQEADSEKEESKDLEQPSESEGDDEMESSFFDTHFEQEATEEDKHEDKQIKQEIDTKEQEVEGLNTALNQKEELLAAIVESNKEMKKSIVDTMKQEYLKKIIALQNEMKKMEGQKERDMMKAKTEASKNTIVKDYKFRIKNMEKELKLLKKKDKEQVDKLRVSKQQKEKIKKLTEEIEGMKAQKVKMMRQIKEEQEKHRKWKTKKAKDLLKMKRSNLKKDQEINKLQRENTKKGNILRRKVEELKALQKRQKQDMMKHKKALNQRRKMKKIDPEKIKAWVMENTKKLMKYQDIKEEMEKEEKAKNETEKEIEEEQNNFASIQVKKEKLEAKRRQVPEDDKDALEDIDQDLRGYELELNNINENMNSLEDKLEFINEKIAVFNKDIIEINPEGIERLRFEEITNLEEAKIYLASFFNIFLEMNVYRSSIEHKLVDQEDVIEKLKQEVEELNNKLQASEVKFREEINKMEQKYKQKQNYIKAEIHEFMKLDLLQSKAKDEEYEEILGESPPRLKKGSSTADLSSKNSKQLRDEIKQRKQALRDVARVQATSKTGLSKLVNSLEKQTQEDEKKIEILNHKLDQAFKEKQMFKQKYQTLKAQVKSNETEDIKLIKTISLETREKYNKSPYGGQRSKPEAERPGLKTLQQARKERLRAPGYGSGDNNSLEIVSNSKKNKNRTPLRGRDEGKMKSLDENNPRAAHRSGLHSSFIYTTAAPKPATANTQNKTATNLSGFVNDESKNDN